MDISGIGALSSLVFSLAKYARDLAKAQTALKRCLEVVSECAFNREASLNLKPLLSNL
jgi:hypothetical protein